MRDFDNERRDEEVMSDYQFKYIMGLKDENVAVKKENEILRAKCAAHYDTTADSDEYMFKRYEEYRDKCDALTKELDSLHQSERTAPGESGMTDFQFKSFLELLYDSIKMSFELGKSQDEILSLISDMIEKRDVK